LAFFCIAENEALILSRRSAGMERRDLILNLGARHTTYWFALSAGGQLGAHQEL